MKITEEQVTLRILKPTIEGNWLTDGETYSQEVWLGVEDTPDRWYEITEAEYQELQEHEN